MTSHGPKAQGKNLKRAALTGSLLWAMLGDARHARGKTLAMVTRRSRQT
ncbi:hypothetical protein [Metallibacterium scheffleri]|nr:hypothetical protein [Metallibacterium scheffleri]